MARTSMIRSMFPADAFDTNEILFSGRSDVPGADNSPAAQADRVMQQQEGFGRFIERTSCLWNQRGRHRGAEQLPGALVPHHDSLGAAGNPCRRPGARSGARRVQRSQPSERRLGSLPCCDSCAPRARRTIAGSIGSLSASLSLRFEPVGMDDAEQQNRHSSCRWRCVTASEVLAALTGDQSGDPCAGHQRWVP